jgi:UDP-N-acetylglucosamine pyrophosphorylase
MKKQIIILAAGKGTRMKSDLPKVMHKVGGEPMLARVMSNCQQVADDLVLVYSEHLEPYLPELNFKGQLVLQEEQLGTAHAVSVAKKYFKKDAYIAVIYGDSPLITSDIIEGLFQHCRENDSKATTLAFEYDKENQYGRIVVDEHGNFQKIVETKFANDEEKKITLCNSGVMVFAPGILGQYIDQCLIADEQNPQKEFYLTEIIELCQKHGEKVSFFVTSHSNLVVGVNTQDELASANLSLQKD